VLTTLAAPPSPPAIIRRVEAAVCDCILRDDILADLPFVDDEDPSQFHPTWKTRVYTLLDSMRPDLGLEFVRWYVGEEITARQESRQVQLPRRFGVRYPVLMFGPDGQIEICRN
jgi:hypothetical protein